MSPRLAAIMESVGWLSTDGIEGIKSAGSKDFLTDQNALTTVREQRNRKL